MMQMGGSFPLSTKLKTGARPGLMRSPDGHSPAQPVPAQQAPVFKATSPTISKHDRFFRRGTLMFIEDEPGDCMFIVKSGRVKILKQEGSKTIELAVLGPGSVLGEMSLLIDAPRSATAQVVEDLTSLCIDKTILEDTFTKIPGWLVTLIKMVVGRLRDTLQKNSENIVRDNMGGVVNLILLMLKDALPDENGRILLPLDALKEEALYTIGLSAGDTDKIVTELILKELMVVGRDGKKQEMVEIRKLDVLRLYFEYLLARHNGKMLPGEHLKEETAKFAAVLLETGPDKGSRDKDGSVTVTRPVVEIAMDRAGLGRFLNMDVIDELSNLGLLETGEKTTDAGRFAHKMASFRFLPQKLKKALLVNEWKAVFTDAQ